MPAEHLRQDEVGVRLVCPDGGEDLVVESGPSGMSGGTRLLIGLGGLALIAVLVGAAMRTNRGR